MFNIAPLLFEFADACACALPGMGESGCRATLMAALTLTIVSAGVASAWISDLTAR